MVKNNRILIVDDDARVRESYQDILSPPLNPDPLSKGIGLYGETMKGTKPASARSYDLTLTTRGDEGIREVEKAVEQQSPFAAAFIDMKMPGIDGAETAKRICILDPAIKIAIVTAYSKYSPDRITRIIGKEDILYLLKPFYPDVIRQSARLFTKQWELDNESRFITSKSSRPTRSHSDKENNLSKAEQERRCPFCKQGVCYRIRRTSWMRLIPLSKHYRCDSCYGTFLKIAEGTFLSSRWF